MKIHANAPLGPKGRATMVRRVLEEGIALMEAAEAAGVSARTARKWVGRYRAEGQYHPATAHWGYPDPSEVQGTADERLAAFRRTLHAIRHRLESFLQDGR